MVSVLIFVRSQGFAAAVVEISVALVSVPVVVRTVIGSGRGGVDVDVVDDGDIGDGGNGGGGGGGGDGGECGEGGEGAYGPKVRVYPSVALARAVVVVVVVVELVVDLKVVRVLVSEAVELGSSPESEPPSSLEPCSSLELFSFLVPSLSLVLCSFFSFNMYL